MVGALALAGSGVRSDWLYLRIYPGGLHKMAPLVRLVVAPAVKLARGFPGVDRWFFLRYVDERGHHLRLRFRGPTGSINRLQRELEHAISGALAQIAATEPLPERRLVPLPIPRLPSDEIGWETDLYEPEVDAYGGATGVEMAETVFERSSDLALRLLTDERWCDGSRVGYALVLMAATADAGHILTERKSLWERYAAFWSGGDDAAPRALRDSFASAAAARTIAVRRECSSVMQQPDWRALVSEYAGTLEKLFANDQLSPAEQRCGQFIHLMNNRLGFVPIEEAYLAFLVRAWEA
jgi:hypothetical protein